MARFRRFRCTISAVADLVEQCIAGVSLARLPNVVGAAGEVKDMQDTQTVAAAELRRLLEAPRRLPKHPKRPEVGTKFRRQDFSSLRAFEQ